MGKIGKGLVKKQGSNRNSSNFVTSEKILDIKKLEKEWEKFKAQETHKVNILPWKITSKKDIAFLTKGDFHKEIGEYVYSFNYFCHPRVHDEKDVLCLKRHFGQECCICDEASKKWDIYNEGGKTDKQKKAAGALTAKLRSMYNIERLTDKRKGKNSFMEASDYIFEDEMLKVALDCEDGEEPVAFYEIDDTDGRVVRFKRPKNARDPSEGFKFLDRSKPISKKLLEGIMKFGELIEIPTPEEVKDFFFGGSFEEESDTDEETIEEKSDTDEETIDEESDSEEETIDEEDEDEDSKKSAGKPVSCPSKKKFGVEYGDFDDCDDCAAEMKCFKANKKA